MKLNNMIIKKDSNHQLNINIDLKELNILITTMDLSKIHDDYNQRELGFLKEESEKLFKKLIALENTIKHEGVTTWN